MSWQRLGSDYHKVTAGFGWKAFEVDTIRATSTAKIRVVARYYVITTVSQLGHWQNQAQPFDVFSVLGSWKCNIIARKPYQGNHWLGQNLLAFKCSSMLTITQVWLKKKRPLYSNNVLLVCGAGQAWEYYKNVIVSVASGDGQNWHRLWWAFNHFSATFLACLCSLNTDFPGSWKQSSKTFQSHFSPITKHFVSRNILHNLKLNNLRIIMEYTSHKLNGCIISKTKSIKLPNR